VTRREADIFAAVVDAVVDPEPPLPAVRDTDAVAAFERWLAAAPPLNRAALRVLLYAIERVTGEGARLRRLPRPGRLRALARWGDAGDALRSAAAGCYWGDAGALRAIGADAATNVSTERVAA
jgi:hypothetical protein